MSNPTDLVKSKQPLTEDDEMLINRTIERVIANDPSLADDAIKQKAIKMLRQLLANQQPVDKEKVARLRQAISEGRYTINTLAIAGKILHLE